MGGRLHHADSEYRRVLQKSPSAVGWRSGAECGESLRREKKTSIEQYADIAQSGKCYHVTAAIRTVVVGRGKTAVVVGSGKLHSCI